MSRARWAVGRELNRQTGKQGKVEGSGGQGFWPDGEQGDADRVRGGYVSERR